MTNRLTSAQRCVLAECVRGALVGWLLTDPITGQECRKMQYRATTVCGFSFSRFVNAARTAFGASYHPSSPGTVAAFPLGIDAAAALANDIELDLATDDQLMAAAIIAAHCPFGQPEVLSRDWRTYVMTLKALGLSIDDDRPSWRKDVHTAMRAFQRRVAAAMAEA